MAEPTTEIKPQTVVEYHGRRGVVVGDQWSVCGPTETPVVFEGEAFYQDVSGLSACGPSMTAPAHTAAREAEWHELRRLGIGASDVAAICGMSSFASALDIWETKTGLREPTPDTAMLEWGRRLEPVVADAFAERTGIAVRRRSREVRWRDWPVLFAHLDRSTPEGPLECKTAMSTRGWGEDGSADVPPHVGLQVQAQLLCADRPRGFVAALIGYRDFRVYEITRDDEVLSDSIVPLLRDFWDHVETNTPPEPDGSESYSAFLRRLHPRDERAERPVTPEEGLLVARLLGATASKLAAERAEEELKQRVMTAMGGDGGWLGDGWRISYKATKDRAATKWELIAKGLSRLVDDEEWQALVGLQTEIKPGSRVFRVTTEEG